MTFEPDHSAPLEVGFEALTSLLRLIADPKSYQRQLDALMAASTRAKEEAAGLKRAQADFASAESEHVKACAEREAAAEGMAAHAASRNATAEQTEARLQRLAADIREHDARLRREIMHFANLMPYWSERLQEIPSWSALADEVLDKPQPPDDGGSAAREELVRLPVSDHVAGSTLARSGPANGRSTRRGV
jgi:hypothetical protein